MIRRAKTAAFLPLFELQFPSIQRLIQPTVLLMRFRKRATIKLLVRVLELLLVELELLQLQVQLLERQEQLMG